MGLIPQVKCGRCDRSYSGLRSRCPYCGAHRHKKGKRVTDGDNSTWKLIIGILLIVVLIAAVVVILVTSLNDAGDSDKDKDKDPEDPGITDPGDPDQIPGSNPGTTDPDDPGTTDPNTPGTPDPGTTDPNDPGTTDPNDPGTTTPGGTDTVIATGIKAKTRYANPVEDFTVGVNETIEVTAIVTPSNATGVPVWSSSDESIVAVVAEDETGIKAKVTGVGKGKVTITVTLDGLSYEFTVYGSGKAAG